MAARPKASPPWPGRESERYPAHPSADDARGETAPATSRCFECAPSPLKGDRPPDCPRHVDRAHPLQRHSGPNRESSDRPYCLHQTTHRSARRDTDRGVLSASGGPDNALASECAARQPDRAFASVAHALMLGSAPAETVAVPDTALRGAQSRRAPLRHEHSRGPERGPVRALPARAHRGDAAEPLLAVREVAAGPELRALSAIAHASLPRVRGGRAKRARGNHFEARRRAGEVTEGFTAGRSAGRRGPGPAS